ncbi:MAG: histidine phosphatase family protein, partial [Alphaproteobacteria bacterium]|nr:histidine phosphatase family protein [Alphaproteobacteria bacterium]
MKKGKTRATLVILRHGQTPYNAANLMTGRRDVPLTPKGEAQAAAVGALIRDMPIDKVYSSSLSRAFNTAALALQAAGKNLPVEKRDEIVEADNGDFTGRNHKTDPEIIAFGRIYGKRMPGGESDKDVVARVRAFYEAEVLPRLLRGENVMIVAHSGVLRAFDIVLGIDPEPADGEPRNSTRRVPNAAPAVYDYEDGAMKGFRYVENPKALPHAA